MTIRANTDLRNWLAQHGSYQGAFEKGTLEYWTGAQPSDANSPMTGTRLNQITIASGARTDEVRATGSIELTAGTTGDTITGITVNNVEILGKTISYGTSLTAVAALIAAQINSYQSVPKYSASSNGAVVTIMAGPRTGTGPNGYAIVVTDTGTFAETIVAMGSVTAGVAQANGLTFGSCVAGKLAKSDDVWSAVNEAGGTAQSWRLCGTQEDDNGTTDGTEGIFRLTGSVSTSGADINMTNPVFTEDATHTQSSFNITVPAYK